MPDAPLGFVAIGASAGGIEAFRQFFTKMPADSGLGFVVVLHLAAGRKSMLPEILARWTRMQVTEARDQSPIAANQVLVVPAGVIATIEDGSLRLKPLPEGAERSLAPIDALFDSVATHLGDSAIGIILSGTGHDGALGLKAIKARGGLTFAQGSDGSQPEYSGMPASAVAADAVDLLVPVEEMPGHILAACKVRLGTAWVDRDISTDSDRSRLAICDLLRSRLGHDFSEYKWQTFMRRVQRRMEVTKLTRLDDYVRLLENDQTQVVLLFRDLLISVTSFFRDPAVFDALAKSVIPALLSGKDAVNGLRVWVPGCATGEEAYSLAIIIREHMDTLAAVPKVQIFASDIDDVAISTARLGRYPGSLLEGVSPQRRERFFVEGPDGYVIRQEVRELCTFSAHSLIRDPPFSRIDLISCRNLLIYMDTDLQNKVIPIFHYALVQNGILVLGSSETISRHEELFFPMDRSQRIFVRRDGPSEIPKVDRFVAGEKWPGTAERIVAASGRDIAWSKSLAAANRRILERFAAPFVVVGAGGSVVHFSGQVSRFLGPATGSKPANLIEMARPAWAPELRAVLQRCIDVRRPFERLCSTMGSGAGEAANIKLVVEPLPEQESEPLFMVAFVEIDNSFPAKEPGDEAAVPDEAAEISRLQRENRNLREQIQSVSEEHATAIEELRSSNEELQSVNEELQSTNEELETSREEIQSVNEELTTVNSQLSTRVEELNRSNADLKNLFESTKVATVFLDPFMIIRSFTPEIARIYNLIPSDIGRPLTDIVSQLKYTTLREEVRSVLQTLQPMERRVERLDNSATYLMRILPYRGPDSTIDGSLITFVDVTAIVRAEEHQRMLVEELNHRVKNMLAVVISLATNTKRRSASLDAFYEVFVGRVHALTAAYALLSRDAWSDVQVREVLMEQLRPFLTTNQTNLTLKGPPVELRPRAALALGMAIHELTTNAVKYGALSVPTGKVTVEWVLKDDATGRVIVLTWREQGGPNVTEPTQRGFGMTLIERAFAHDVGGQAAVSFEPGGIVATLSAPLPAAPLASGPPPSSPERSSPP